MDQCVCVCVCVRERKRQEEKEWGRDIEIDLTGVPFKVCPLPQTWPVVVTSSASRIRHCLQNACKRNTYSYKAPPPWSGHGTDRLEHRQGLSESSTRELYHRALSWSSIRERPLSQSAVTELYYRALSYSPLESSIRERPLSQSSII